MGTPTRPRVGTHQLLQLSKRNVKKANPTELKTDQAFENPLLKVRITQGFS